MCSSKAEGGKRCFSHLSKDYKAATRKVAALTGAAAEDDVVKSQEKYEHAVASLAAEPTGLLHLRNRAAAIEAGDTLGGDDLQVLRRYAPPKEPSATTVSVTEALATGRPVREDPTPRPQVPRVQRSDGEFAQSLAEALAFGKPMAPEVRVTKTVAPPSAFADTAFASALRGETSPFVGEVTSLPGGLDENGPALLG